MSIAFHSIDLPSKGGTDLPFIMPTDTTAAGITDFAGNPFWLNGQPNLGVRHEALAASGAQTYDGSARADSGLPVGRPAAFKLTFTKPGSYAYYCDLHYGMRGIVVVTPSVTRYRPRLRKSRRSPHSSHATQRSPRRWPTRG